MDALSPKLLCPGIAKNLNCRTYDTTGCFCFLNTDTLPLYRSIEARDSFQALVIILYCLYHDYGRDFLRTCLSKKFVPPSAASDPSFADQRLRAEMHVSSVCKILRAGLCHGSFPCDQSRYELPEALDEYCKGQLANKNDCWNDAVIKIQKYKQKNWSDAKARLTQESDSMLEYLYAWGDLWDGESDARKDQLMQHFFKASRNGLNMSIVEPIIKYEHIYSGKTKYYYDREKLNIALPGFRSDIQNKFLSYAYRDPEEIYQDLVKLVKNHIMPPPTSSIQKSKGTPFDVTE